MDSSSGGLLVQNVEIAESPIVNSNEDWVDVTFVWDPGESNGVRLGRISIFLFRAH